MTKSNNHEYNGGNFLFSLCIHSFICASTNYFPFHCESNLLGGCHFQRCQHLGVSRQPNAFTLEFRGYVMRRLYDITHTTFVCSHQTKNKCRELNLCSILLSDLIILHLEMMRHIFMCNTHQWGNSGRCWCLKEKMINTDEWKLT